MRDRIFAMAMFERLDAVSRGLLILLIGLLPFFFVPVAWVTVSRAKIGLVALVLLVVAVLWIIARFLERGVRMPWNIVIGAAALLPLSYAVSVAISGFESISLVGSGREIDTLAFIATAFGALVLAASLFATYSAAARAAPPPFLLGPHRLAPVQIF